MTDKEKAEHAATMVINCMMGLAENSYEKLAISESREDWEAYFIDLIKGNDLSEYKVFVKQEL